MLEQGKVWGRSMVLVLGVLLLCSVLVEVFFCWDFGMKVEI
jgi:hypothetical protein